MKLRILCLAVLLVSFAVTSGCGPGGADLVEGLYSGPTAPAMLGDEAEGQIEEVLEEGQGSLEALYSLASMVTRGVGYSLQARFDGCPYSYVDEIDEVVQADDGWYRIVGTISETGVLIDGECQESWEYDVVIEFHDAYFNGDGPFVGSLRMLDRVTDHPSGELSSLWRIEARDLRGPFQAFDRRGVAEDPMDTSIVLNGYSEVYDIKNLEGTASWRERIDLTMLFLPSEEQTRILAEWVGSFSAGQESGDGFPPIEIKSQPRLQELPRFFGSESINSSGTIFSTRLGGSVRFTGKFADFDDESVLWCWGNGCLAPGVETPLWSFALRIFFG